MILHQLTVDFHSRPVQFLRRFALVPVRKLECLQQLVPLAISFRLAVTSEVGQWKMACVDSERWVDEN